MAELGSLRHRVAAAIRDDGIATDTPWHELTPERQAHWLKDADRVIPIVVEACARLVEQRHPADPTGYLFPRERLGVALRGLFLGAPEEDKDA